MDVHFTKQCSLSLVQTSLSFNSFLEWARERFLDAASRRHYATVSDVAIRNDIAGSPADKDVIAGDPAARAAQT